MFLLVDNYDSFTWNIYHSIASKGIKVVVKRNDKVNIKKLSDSSYKGIIFSPGPGHPKDSFSMIEIIKIFKKKNTTLRDMFRASSISILFWS